MKRERYAKTPDSVLLDAGLSSDAKVIYGVLARHGFSGGKVYLGQRRIGEFVGMSQSKVSRLIRGLISKGYAELLAVSPGQRGGYRLTSNIFEKREKSEYKAGKKWGSLMSPTMRMAAGAARSREESA